MNSFGQMVMAEHQHGDCARRTAGGDERPVHDYIGKRLRQHYPPARAENMPPLFRELLEALDGGKGTRPRLKTSFRD